LPSDFNDLVHQSLDWSPDPNAAISCPSAADTKGSTPPKCLNCPSPSFTDAARKAHWQGDLMLKVAVDEQGQVTSAIALIGGPYGVDEQAIATVRQWQFQPATNREGQPVRICVPVEVTLRSY
jgi:TonB family protein